MKREDRRVISIVSSGPKCSRKIKYDSPPSWPKVVNTDMSSFGPPALHSSQLSSFTILDRRRITRSGFLVMKSLHFKVGRSLTPWEPCLARATGQQPLRCHLGAAYAILDQRQSPNEQWIVRLPNS